MPVLPADPRTRRTWLLSAFGILVAVAVATWYALAMEAKTISPEVTSYKVVDDTSTVIDFDVRRPDGMTIVCTVAALDAKFATAGAQDVRIEAGGDRTVHRQVTLRTTHRAVSGTVKECRKAD